MNPRIRELLLDSFPFIILTALYMYCAAWTVQGTDTGELVTNSWLLRVSHPPGYPLFHFLYWAFMHALPVGTIFFRASVLTIIISILTLIPLHLMMRGQLRIWRYLVILAAGTSYIFWRYAVLPEVFMLNNLFISWICYYYLRDKKKYFIQIVVLFAFGMSNHHTLVFLIPLVLHSFFENFSYKGFLISIVSFSIMTLIYTSLFFLNDKSLTSWPLEKSVKGLVEHVLRLNYGMLKLTQTTRGDQYFSYNIKFLFEYSFSLVMAFLGALLISQKKIQKVVFSNLIIPGSLIVYIILFFSLANVKMFWIFDSIVERFFLLPQMLFIIIVIFYFPVVSRKNRYYFPVVVLMCITVLLNIYFYFPHNNYKGNTVFEDYAINRLNSPQDNPVILETEDEGLYSLFYVNQVLGIRPEALIVTPDLFFPEVVARELEMRGIKIHGDFDSFFSFFLKYKDDVTFNYDYGDQPRSKNYAFEYTPGGANLIRGVESTFRETAIIRRNDMDILKIYDVGHTERNFFKMYPRYYLHRSDSLIQIGALDEAKKVALKGLELLPDDLDSRKFLCLRLEMREYCY